MKASLWDVPSFMWYMYMLLLSIMIFLLFFNGMFIPIESTFLSVFNNLLDSNPMTQQFKEKLQPQIVVFLNYINMIPSIIDKFFALLLIGHILLIVYLASKPANLWENFHLVLLYFIGLTIFASLFEAFFHDFAQVPTIHYYLSMLRTVMLFLINPLALVIFIILMVSTAMLLKESIVRI